MRKILLSVAVMMASLGLQAADANYQVVPLPQNIALEKGAPFVLSGNTAVVVEGTDEAMQRNAAFLNPLQLSPSGLAILLANCYTYPNESRHC